MAIATAPAPAPPVEHAPPPAHSRLPINRLGIWLFFFSDGLLFAMLAASRFYLTGTHRPEELNQLLGLGITGLLLASSLTAYRAETAFEHGNSAHGRQMLLATIFMGALFAIGVGFEWSIAHWTPSDPFGTAFFSMTGMHAAHVVSGVLFLTVIYLRAGRGHFPVGNTWPVTAMVMYWHFVDVVWVFFYPTLYLVE
jgi:cytochrome c oxidase subunit 3